ncbi:MAG TPA: hypothetical protein VEI97_19725, partial [bacterium]|nr:hypothetical protein [bacterium]
MNRWLSGQVSNWLPQLWTLRRASMVAGPTDAAPDTYIAPRNAPPRWAGARLTTLLILGALTMAVAVDAAPGTIPSIEKSP